MCRNIKKLRREKPPVTDADFAEAALNLVRKLSGYREPSVANRAIFEQAVEEITEHTKILLRALKFRGQG